MMSGENRYLSQTKALTRHFVQECHAFTLSRYGRRGPKETASLTSERSFLPEHQPSGLVHLGDAHPRVTTKNPHPGLKPTPLLLR